MEIKGRTKNAKGSNSYWLTEMSHAEYNETILLSGETGGELRMLRVLIADDESKVCQLIEKLVDWDVLGMEVVAVPRTGSRRWKK